MWRTTGPVVFVFCFPGIAEERIFKTLLLKEYYVFSTVIVVLNITAPCSTSGIFWTSKVEDTIFLFSKGLEI